MLISRTNVHVYPLDTSHDRSSFVRYHSSWVKKEMSVQRLHQQNSNPQREVKNEEVWRSRINPYHGLDCHDTYTNMTHRPRTLSFFPDAKIRKIWSRLEQLRNEKELHSSQWQRMYTVHDKDVYLCLCSSFRNIRGCVWVIFSGYRETVNFLNILRERVIFSNSTLEH